MASRQIVDCRAHRPTRQSGRQRRLVLLRPAQLARRRADTIPKQAQLLLTPANVALVIDQRGPPGGESLDRLGLGQHRGIERETRLLLTQGSQLLFEDR